MFISILFLYIGLIISCSKTTSNGRVPFKLKSYNPSSVQLNQPITFNFEFSHPYSSKVTDTLHVIVKYKTCTLTTPDTIQYVLPVFENAANQTCQLEYKFNYGSGGNLNGCSNSNGQVLSDSATFYFWLIDKNQNSSDTIQSNKIFLQQN